MYTATLIGKIERVQTVSADVNVMRKYGLVVGFYITRSV